MNSYHACARVRGIYYYTIKGYIYFFVEEEIYITPVDTSIIELLSKTGSYWIFPIPNTSPVSAGCRTGLVENRDHCLLCLNPAEQTRLEGRDCPPHRNRDAPLVEYRE